VGRLRVVRAVRKWLTGVSRGRLALPLGGLAVVALAVGVIVASELPGSSQGASPVPKSSGSATVARRDLVATDTQSGTLGYTQQRTIYNRVSGTITWLPAAGQVIKPGQPLYKVDNSPIVLFNGTTPAYRTLSSSDTAGPDVLELNQALVDLGFAQGQITVNDTWQAGTTAAVDRWQASLGETQTGTITLGQVVFLNGPQLVGTVSAVLGSSGGSSGSGSGSGAPASTPVAAPRPQFVSLTTTTTATTPASPSGATGTSGPSGPSGSSGSSGSGGSSNSQLKALVALLQAEIAELRSAKSSSSGSGALKPTTPSTSASRGGSSGSGGSGSSGGSAGSSASSASGGGSSASGSGSASAVAVMQTTSTQEVVTVNLDATKQSEAVIGEPVTVQLPDGSSVNGKITGVSPVAQSSSSGSGGGSGGSGAGGSSSTPTATIPVTVTLTGHTHVSGLDQAAVSVNFAQQRANNVLSVPVTALIAVQGGGYAVQEAAAPHRLVPVTPGLFAAGYVQVSGTGIYPGLAVTDSQG
jgi:hypothetical protein